MVTQADRLFDGIEYRFSLLAELIDFSRSIGAVATEYRAEEGVLHPTYIELLELDVLRSRTASLGVIRTAEESTYIGIEVRTSGHGVVQAQRNLLAEHVP